MSKRLQLALGISFFALMFFYLAMRVYTGLVVPGLVSRRGWTAEWREGKAIVAAVGAQSPATAVVRDGDEVIALQSERSAAMPIVTPNLWRVPPGTPYTLTVRRDGQTQELALYTTVLQTGGPQIGGSNFFLLIFLLFTFTGLLVFLLKPGDKQAWLLALILGSLVALYPHSYNSLTVPRWAMTLMMVAGIIALVFMPAFLHFFLIFPERSPLLRRWPHLVRALYLLFGLVILPFFAVTRTARYFAPNSTLAQLFGGRTIDLVITTAAVLYMVGGLLSMLINYRAASPGARRKLRVVMVGSGAGFFNLLLMPVGEATGLARAFPALWQWLANALLITLPLVPISFAYAIIKHQVIPISLIIRRGMRYLLVSRGSILLVMVGVAVAMFFVMDAFFSRLKPTSGRIVGGISGVVAIIVWQLARAFHRRVVAPRIDRLFFHQAYDTQQIIAELVESLRTATSLPRLLEMVATRIQSALQTTNVAILLRDEASGDYRCAYACEYSFHNRQPMRYPCDSSLPHDSTAITRLAASAQPIEIDSHDPQFSLSSTNGIEGEALRQLKSALLMPIVGKDRLLGVISLGPHLGDLPFSSEDKKLLLSVGGPTSFALENARLIERMIEDARRHQELEVENEQRAKELEEARRLQLSMLPKTVPQLPHLDIAAYMKTATEVGGDYYDFHLADDGTLTVAVGDATGHGLKAGTVVTAMKSLFHCYAGEPELLPVLNQSSRVLKRMNLRSLFMGLTVIKLRGRQLKISAAGMPPALIYRVQTGVVEEVLIKAMPLGSLTNYTYREWELTLESGDVLVLMSDGLPERFNLEGEMFDYTRVKTTLIAAATHSAQSIIERLVSAGETWAQGRPQDDDVTFVVLKVK